MIIKERQAKFIVDNYNEAERLLQNSRIDYYDYNLWRIVGEEVEKKLKVADKIYGGDIKIILSVDAIEALSEARILV